MPIDDELRAVIRATVEETLTSLGIDITNPLETQHDLAYLREFRTTTRALVRRALLVAVGGLVTGAGAVFWLGLRTVLGSG